MKPRILFLITLLCAAIAGVQIVHAATFNVTNTGDNGGVNPAPGAGTGTLRQAIVDSNANAGADSITFNPGVTGTILLASVLPELSDDVDISGPGANALTVKRDPSAAAFRIFFVNLGTTVTIDGLTITNGVTGDFPDYRGGGIYNRGTLTVSNSTISGNSALEGGGIYNDHATLTITNSTISGNSATSFSVGGGGIYNSGFDGSATMTITNSTISSNSATGEAGGIYNDGRSDGSATLTITNSTISGNSAGFLGGAILNDGKVFGTATLTITNSTFSDNSAVSGGGIYNDGFSHAVSVTVTISNTILNAGASGVNIANFGTVHSLGYNLSSDAAGGDTMTSPGGFLNATGDIRNTDPNLGLLADNGGPTFTHELLTGSPAINAGDPAFVPPPDYDQRGTGFPRVVNNRIDIGAFEVQSVSLTMLGVASCEDFDTLASSGTSSTTPVGWTFSESNVNANTTYTAGNGSEMPGDTYSFGSTGSTDRAFGALQSNTLNPTVGAAFTNNTGQTIGSLLIAYTGEQWRLGAVGRLDRLDFQFSTDATSLTTGTWTDVNQLDFNAPISAGTVGALDGNAAANRVMVTFTINGQTIADGATFWVRWTDFNATGADDGLSIDDFCLTPLAEPTPPPNVCPKSQGYWKNNPNAWPVNSLMLGSQTYTTTELLRILRTSVGTGTKADASLILADQLIAAKLNIANGADDPAPVPSTITDADAVLSIYPGRLPYRVRPNTTNGRRMVSDANTLNSYNNGLLTPVCTP